MDNTGGRGSPPNDTGRFVVPVGDVPTAGKDKRQSDMVRALGNTNSKDRGCGTGSGGGGHIRTLVNDDRRVLSDGKPRHKTR